MHACEFTAQMDLHSIIFLIIFLFAYMLSKNKRPEHWESLTREARFRSNVEDLYASNLVSADRVNNILGDAGNAGVKQPARAVLESLCAWATPRKVFLEYLPQVFPKEGIEMMWGHDCKV